MKRWKWPLVWLAQWASMFAAGLLIAASDLLGAAVYAAASWIGMPLLGAVSAYRATRRGLLNYAAWIAPPVCALISLVGAAAGEVMNQRPPRS